MVDLKAAPQMSTPRDLAVFVHEYMASRPGSAPSLEHLAELFGTLFSLSLKSEESRFIRCSVLYQSRKCKPTGKGGAHVENSFWTANLFGSPLEFTLHTLRKLAPAVDPEVASIGVYPNKSGRLMIWGIVDQFPLHMLRYTSWETDRRGPFAHGLHSSISAPGELIVYTGDRVLATLRQEQLICRETDALWHGPLAAKLGRYVRAFTGEIRKGVGTNLFRSAGEFFRGTDEEWKCSEDYSDEARDSWLGTLCRLLLRIRNHRHGGALLIIPGATTPDLDIRCHFTYDRIHDHLCDYFAALICQTFIEVSARQGRLDEITYPRPMTSKLGYFTTPDARENVFTARECGGYDENLFRSWFYTASRIDAMAALAGSIALVSSLSRVDGLLLMSGGLRLQGFGTEIRTKRNVETIDLALDPQAATTITANPNSYGTRHRSMMRYCSEHRGSVGFVISQDGDIRAITKVGKRLIMWEHLQLKAGMADEHLHRPHPFKDSKPKRLRLSKQV